MEENEILQIKEYNNNEWAKLAHEIIYNSYNFAKLFQKPDRIISK